MESDMGMTAARVTERVNAMVASNHECGNPPFSPGRANQMLEYIREVRELGIIEQADANELSEAAHLVVHKRGCRSALAPRPRKNGSEISDAL